MTMAHTWYFESNVLQTPLSSIMPTRKGTATRLAMAGFELKYRGEVAGCNLRTASNVGDMGCYTVTRRGMEKAVRMHESGAQA